MSSRSRSDIPLRSICQPLRAFKSKCDLLSEKWTYGVDPLFLHASLFIAEQHLPKSIRSAHHRALIAVLVGCRKQAGLTQLELAKTMKRTQSFVAQVEAGQRQVYVAELFEFARAFKLDPVELFRRVASW